MFNKSFLIIYLFVMPNNHIELYFLLRILILQ